MMRRPLRLSALFFAAASAKSSLLQEANQTVKTDRKFSQPLAGLLESAKGLLTNGATPEVQTFVELTLQDLSNSIIPAILEESLADKSWMATALAKFAHSLTALRSANLVISAKNAEEVSQSGIHKSCRAVEKTVCDSKRDCEMSLWDKWKTWAFEEVELEEDHLEFSTHFCKEDANGTLNTFRQDSVVLMSAWLTVREKCETARGVYDAKLPDCETANLALDDKSANCNSDLTTLEDTACEHSDLIIESLIAFHDTWKAHHASYQAITDLVYAQTDDRKKEYKTLKVVECLLGKITEQNGRPCDETTGTADDKMHECRDAGEALDICADPTEVVVSGSGTAEVKDICQEFIAPPSTPVVCENRDPLKEVGGVQLLCIPHPGLHFKPCEAYWLRDEMDSLPSQDWNDPLWSQSQSQTQERPSSSLMSETNPGCNVYPDCYQCNSDLVVPGEDYITWLPPTGELRLDLSHEAYSQEAHTYARDNLLVAPTRDGCTTQGGNDHPFTMRSVDVTAAVRCCFTGAQEDRVQEDGSYSTDEAPPPPCKSMTHLEDGQEECRTSATFHEANAICRDEGMRLCTEEEMDNLCCGIQDNCNFNNAEVWLGYHYSMFDVCDNEVDSADSEARQARASAIVSTEVYSTASVRCCSLTVESCETNDLLEGCDGLADKTHAEAVAICQNNDMRLCTETEISERICCDSSCDFDNDRIWVSH